MSSAERKSERPASAEDAPEESFWAAAGGFSEDAADEHASKIFALWELGGDHAALQPADDGGGEEDAGAWSAEPAEASSETPAAAAEAEPDAPAAASAPAEPAPEEAPPAAQATPAAEETPAAASATPAVTKAAKPARPAPEPLPPRAAEDQVVLPRSGGATKTFVAIGIAAVALVGVAVFAFSGGEPTPPPDEPTAAAEPASPEATEPEPAAAPEVPEPAPTPEPAASEPAAPVIAAAVAEPAEAPIAPAAPEPTTSALRVRTEPADATLTVDGREVDNPFEAELEVGAEVRLSAEASGYRRATRSVRVGDEAEAVTLTLERRARRQPRRRPRPARRAPREQTPANEPPGAGFTTANPY